MITLGREKSSLKDQPRRNSKYGFDKASVLRTRNVPWYRRFLICCYTEYDDPRSTYINVGGTNIDTFSEVILSSDPTIVKNMDWYRGFEVETYYIISSPIKNDQQKQQIVDSVTKVFKSTIPQYFPSIVHVSKCVPEFKMKSSLIHMVKNLIDQYVGQHIIIDITNTLELDALMNVIDKEQNLITICIQAYHLDASKISSFFENIIFGQKQNKKPEICTPVIKEFNFTADIININSNHIFKNLNKNVDKIILVPFSSKVVDFIEKNTRLLTNNQKSYVVNQIATYINVLDKVTILFPSEINIQDILQIMQIVQDLQFINKAGFIKQSQLVVCYSGLYDNQNLLQMHKVNFGIEQNNRNPDEFIEFLTHSLFYRYLGTQKSTFAMGDQLIINNLFEKANFHQMRILMKQVFALPQANLQRQDAKLFIESLLQLDNNMVIKDKISQIILNIAVDKNCKPESLLSNNLEFLSRVRVEQSIYSQSNSKMNQQFYTMGKSYDSPQSKKFKGNSQSSGLSSYEHFSAGVSNPYDHMYSQPFQSEEDEFQFINDQSRSASVIQDNVKQEFVIIELGSDREIQLKSKNNSVLRRIVSKEELTKQQGNRESNQINLNSNQNLPENIIDNQLFRKKSN